MKLSLSDGEWKLMNLLWEDSPLTISAMVERLADDTGWSKATVNIMLGRLSEKGVIWADTSGRAKLFYPKVSRDEAVKQEARKTLARIKTGGLGLLVNTMARECELSDSDIEELYRELKKGRSEHD